MKLLPFILTLVVASPVAPVSRLAFGQNSTSKAPNRVSLRTLIPYNPTRFGFESQPVQVVGAGAGKFNSREKFKIFVSSLRNKTDKDVKAIKITCFISTFSGWDGRQLETIQTSLVPLKLLAFEQREVDILVGYVDDIPLLGLVEELDPQIEVAVTEVQYTDGAIWQGTDLPHVPPAVRIFSAVRSGSTSHITSNFSLPMNTLALNISGTSRLHQRVFSVGKLMPVFSAARSYP